METQQITTIAIRPQNSTTYALLFPRIFPRF
jgi:hypothetical protein